MNNKSQIIASILKESHLVSEATLKKVTKKALLALYKSIGYNNLSNVISTQKKINQIPLIDLKSILPNIDIVVSTNKAYSGKGAILFKTIAESKAIIKEHRLIIATSYDKLIPLINTAIKSKKMIYPNMSNKNIIKLIKGDFDTKDTLINNSFYLKELKINLPFGVNKTQIMFVVKHNKSKLLSNNSLKNLSLEELVALISATKLILKEISDNETYNAVKVKKDAIIVDVQLIA